MNKRKQLWAGAAAAIILIGIVYYMWPTATEAPTINGRDTSTETGEQNFVKAPTTPPKSTSASVPTQTTTAPRVGLYAPYTADRLANASRGPVVLFFNSASCAGCKALDADIRSHALSIPRDVTILEVDFDTNAELKQKYGVQAPHLIVQVDTRGGRVTQWSGSPTLTDIATRVVRF